MGDWADQPYPVLLTEPWNPAPYGNFRICWLWTINRVLLLCAFILVVALKNKPCALFHLSALSFLRTCKYRFHLPLSCKVGSGKLSLCKTQRDVQVLPLDLRSKDKVCNHPLWLPLPIPFCLKWVKVPAGNASRIQTKREALSWVMWMARPWVRAPEWWEYYTFRLHPQTFASLDFKPGVPVIWGPNAFLSVVNILSIKPRAWNL